jgi:hypothetical protein
MRQLSRTTLALVLAATLAPSAFAANPNSQPNASTSLTITPTPVVLDGSPAADAMADTVTTSAAVSTAVIDQGKVTLQMATYGGLPAIDGASTTWTSLPPGNISPSGGSTHSALDFDGLGFVPGTTASFRAHYVTGGGQTKADTHFSPAIDVTAVGDTCQGFNISADFASGNGTPPRNSDGPWQFRIRLENCTGIDLAGIKAQGGTNGWAPMTDYVPSKGTVAVRYNNKNQVLTWNLDMPSGTTETLLVTVDGHIPASAACESLRYLSGPWSAVYNPGTGAVKSDYTGRVTVTVACPLLKTAPTGDVIILDF